MLHEQVKTAWMNVDKVALPLAEIRDEYLKFKGMEGRFMQMNDAYRNLNTLGDALFEYIEIKSPLFGKKPDREILMIAEAAVKNGQILLDVAKGELALLGELVKDEDRLN